DDAALLAVLLLGGELQRRLDALEDHLAWDVLLIVHQLDRAQHIGTFHRCRPLETKKSGSLPTWMPPRARAPERISPVSRSRPRRHPEIRMQQHGCTWLTVFSRESAGQARATRRNSLACRCTENALPPHTDLVKRIRHA